MKWVRRILLFALAGFSLIAIFIVGAAYYGAGKIITRTSSDEHRIIHGNPETALGLACEDVSFKAEGRGDAARLVCERSPVPMARAHRHCTRVVCATAQESLKPETGWWMTQSDANCSPWSNSLMIRENTGNIRDFGSPRPTW